MIRGVAPPILRDSPVHERNGQGTAKSILQLKQHVRHLFRVEPDRLNTRSMGDNYWTRRAESSYGRKTGAQAHTRWVYKKSCRTGPGIPLGCMFSSADTSSMEHLCSVHFRPQKQTQRTKTTNSTDGCTGSPPARTNGIAG